MPSHSVRRLHRASGHGKWCLPGTSPILPFVKAEPLSHPVLPDSPMPRRRFWYRRVVRLFKAGIALAAVVVASAMSPAAFAESDADKAAARQLATQGGQALAANKYAEALDLVTRAEAMFHAPTHLAMLARAQIGLGHYVAAREAYLKLAREELAPNAPAAFKAAVDEAREKLPIVEAKIANLRIALRGAEGKKVTVKLDEQPVPEALLGVFAPTDPGKHDVSISSGGAPVHTSVELGPGEKKEVTLDAPSGPDAAPAGAPPEAAPAPATSGGFFTPMRIAGVAVGAAGVGGAAVGTIFLAGFLSGKSDAQKRYDGCNPGCMPTEVTSIKAEDKQNANKGTVATIGLTAGGALLVAGVTLVVLGKPSAASQSTGALHLSPYFAGTAAGVAGTF